LSLSLLAVDLDGTLLDTAGRPHERDLRALRAAIDAGVTVTIVTGRLYSGTRPSAQALGLRGPVACADGSHLVRAHDHETLLHHGIRGSAAAAVRESLVAHGAAGFLFVRERIIHDAGGDPFVDYVRLWSSDIQRILDLGSHQAWEDVGDADGVTAVVAVGTAEQIARTCEGMRLGAGDAAQVVSFPIRRVEGMWGLVARGAGGTKGSALHWIADHHGIPRDETACVGDWLNDIPMLRVAGRSYAMGQAPDEVKKHASVVLTETSETGGGIARVVEEAFGVRVP
jgi:Cof subfamily protein (haloacid dehalogenase superfamily)